MLGSRGRLNEPERRPVQPTSNDAWCRWPRSGSRWADTRLPARSHVDGQMRFIPHNDSIRLMKQFPIFLALIVLGNACGKKEASEPDLPRQPDRWVNSVQISPDTRVQFIGKTRELLLTSATTIRELDSIPRIAVGDTIEGVSVGAIRCSFHWRDASHGGEQFMWRGRWSCQAGRNREEVENAVGEDGTKRFEYLHLSPVAIDPQ